jgi:phospholipid/cholesterol/gamma-HCH transport system substrate-binding protein
MTERSRNISVGLTAILGAIGFAVLLMLFGAMPKFNRKFYDVTIAVPHASGLSENSKIRLSGIEVGRVRSVELGKPPKYGATIVGAIEHEVDLPKGTVALISSPLLGGAAALDLRLPEDDDEPAATSPSDATTSGASASTQPATTQAASATTVNTPTTRPAKTRTIAMLTKDGSATIEGDAPSLTGALSKELRAAIREPMAKFEKLSVAIEELAHKWGEVADNISAITKSRSPAEVDASGGNLMGNLATVLARADQRLAEMQKTIDGVNEWVADKKLRSDIQATADNARQTSEKLKGAVDETSQNIERLTKRYVAVADDLSAAVISMRKAIDQARQGEGTVGKLLNDPSLFNNLNDASGRLNKALDEFKLLLEKWKAEGLPVQF